MPGRVTETNRIDAVRAWWTAWESGRPHAAAPFVQDELVVRTVVGAGPPTVGITETREMVERLADEGLRIRPEAERFEETGAYVLVSGSITTTRDHGSQDVAAAWWVFYVPDGRIASVTAKRSEAAALEHVEWDRR